MSDTTDCSSCGAQVPTAAKFCTTCGHAMAADATNVEHPRPDGATQVLPPVQATPDPPAWQPPAAETAPPSQPWQPADSGAASSAPPQAPAWGQQQPTASAPTSWQQPPAAPGYGQPQAGPPQGGQPAWGQPPAQQPAWGQAPASPPNSSKAKTPSPIGGLVALVGGVLTLVGIFTAWVGPKGGGENLTGWDLTSGDKLLKSADPYLLLALAVVAIAIGIVRFTGALAPVARAAAVIAGLVIIGVMIRDWLSIVDVVKDFSSDVRVEQKFGYFLAIAGGAATAISALMPSAKKAE